ncbi:sce7726 family protein [Limibacterium fermenti]|uniref:sce7726 family protein n=1 Tax=Limibacterium fermenti TaxID=3229863 RepID=UPI003A605626
MKIRLSYSIDQLRDYSTLFLRNEVCKWLNNDFSSINQKVQTYDLVFAHKDISYLQYIRHIYKVLAKNYPNEYIYKNELLNKWLKKEFANKDSVIFNEFRIGKAIADLAIFNGTSKVFEIKTILDKEYRLSNQLEEYKRIFNEIYLVVPELHLDKYMAYDSSIGVISYDSTEGVFRLIRKAVSNKRPDFSTVMEILHTREYKNIVETYYGMLPEMNDFNQFQICKELIRKIPSDEMNGLFIHAMKKRNINNQFFNKINSELNQVCLSLNLNKTQKENLLNILKTKISI